MALPLVVLHGQVLVDLGDGILRERVVLQVIDRAARELAAAHEDPPLFSLDEHAVVGVVADEELRAAGVIDVEQEGRRRVVAVLFDSHTIAERNRVHGRAPDRSRPRCLPVEGQRPDGEIHVVGAPVGELAPRILVPPAKFIVTVGLFFAFLADDCGIVKKPVVAGRRGPEPAVPVEPLGHRGHRDRSARRRPADRRLHLRDPAETPLGHDGHRLGEEVERAPLLGAHLHDPPRLLLHPANEFALVDRQRERLLAVDVLAGEHRLHDGLRVPVVGRGDVDHVHVLAFQDPPVVVVDVGLPTGMPLVEPGGPPRIDVGDRHDIDPVLGRFDVEVGDAARADQPKGDAVVLGPRFVRQGAGRREEIRHRRGSEATGARREKIAPRVVHGFSCLGVTCPHE